MVLLCLSVLFAAAASADYITGYSARPPAAQAPLPTTSATALTEVTLDAAFSSKDAYYATAMPTFGTDSAGLAAESSFIVEEEAFYETAYPAAPTPTGPDACGPTIPDPSVPDSCDTPIEQVDQPSPWGVQCLNDTDKTNPDPITAINITSCATLIMELCANQWQHPDEWVWLTANGCSIGSFLPGPKLPGHAPWPQGVVCEQLIYASMIDSCEYSGYGYSLAAVNVKTLPSNKVGGSGEAVNVGYGSYIVASRQLRKYSDVKDCVDQYQTTTACDVLNSPAAVFTPAPGGAGAAAADAPAPAAPAST